MKPIFIHFRNHTQLTPTTLESCISIHINFLLFGPPFSHFHRRRPNPGTEFRLHCIFFTAEKVNIFPASPVYFLQLFTKYNKMPPPNKFNKLNHPNTFGESIPSSSRTSLNADTISLDTESLLTPVTGSTLTLATQSRRPSTNYSTFSEFSSDLSYLSRVTEATLKVNMNNIDGEEIFVS